MCQLASIIIPLLLFAFVAGSVYFYQANKTGQVDEKYILVKMNTKGIV